MSLRGARFAPVVILVCDSLGVGDAPDAADFGDEGANTLGHVIEFARPALPNLSRTGLARLPGIALPPGGDPEGAWGRLTPRGPGKDTMLGHWELMGLVAEAGLPLYPDGFPPEVLAIVRAASGRGSIGNRPASGTEIIQELGTRHRRDGDLIVYTSGDSVLQIAAHEDVMVPEELYEICRRVRRRMEGEHAVGRVIARPFTGEGPGRYRRTTGRRDFPLPPPRPTALDRLSQAGRKVHAVGKIHDIFTGRGIATHAKTGDNQEGIEATLAALVDPEVDLVFTNLVDFDTDYGHRNDPAGYAAAVEEFDRRLPELRAALPPTGCLIVTADHGNDPTTPGTDHSRERVPLLVFGGRVKRGAVGDRDFADLGATLLENFGVDAPTDGRSFLDRL